MFNSKDAAALVLGLADSEFRFERLRPLADILDPGPDFVLGHGEPWRPETKDMWAQSILDGSFGKILYWWETRAPDAPIRPEMGAALNISEYRSINMPNFEWNDHTLLVFQTHENGVPLNDPRKWQFILAKFRAVVDELKPPYAIIDHLWKNIRPFKNTGEDLRKHAWGATILGPSLVEILGREKILATPAWRIEELSWGGIWIQLAENPFTVPPRTKKKATEHLGLDQLQAGDPLVLRPPRGTIRSTLTKPKSQQNRTTHQPPK